MKCSNILLALEDSLDEHLIFLKSSQTSQNSMFSSLNSDLRKVWNVAMPSTRTNRGVNLWLNANASVLRQCSSMCLDT